MEVPLVKVESTPNPSARKFTVGAPVGGPSTFTSPDDATGWAAAILALDGVTSVFATADFVTVTAPGADWESITPAIVDALEGTFADPS